MTLLLIEITQCFILQEEWNLPGAVAENEMANNTDTPTASDIIISEVENHQEEPVAKEPETVVRLLNSGLFLYPFFDKCFHTD